jgi:hypothetical protein
MCEYIAQIGSEYVLKYLQHNHHLHFNEVSRIVDIFFATENNPRILSKILEFIVNRLKMDKKLEHLFSIPFECPQFAKQLESLGEDKVKEQLTRLMTQV